MRLPRGPARDFIVPLRFANANLSGRGPSTLPAARPFRRLKSPLGTLLFRCAPQTRTCRGGAPPSCCRKTVRSLKSPAGAFIAPRCCANANLSGRGPSTLPAARPFRRLKSPLGTLLFRCAPQTRTCRGGAPPSCCRKTVRSLKSPAGAFIAPRCCANANLSGRGPSTLPAARPFRRLKSPLGTLLFRCAPQTRTCRGGAPPPCLRQDRSVA